MTEKILDIYTDGGARGNPGPSGIGVVIKENNENIATFAKYIGEGTNNQAEYEAVILGLEEAKKITSGEINFFIDSELVVNQLNRKYKVKDQKLGSLFVKAWNLMVNFQNVTYTHIRREKNTEADALANQAMDAQK